jgi:surface protein
MYRYFPKTKEELVEIIKVEVKKNGWNCDLNHIDTSKITDMSYLFSKDSAGYGLGDLPGYNLEKFNGDISRWNVSNVTNMSHMFYGANSFNQPIGDWDVSNVTNMDYMFFDADSFNHPIGNWNVSNVINMHNMF